MGLRLMIFCGRGMPSRRLLARLGVPVGGRVEKFAQWKINQASSLGGNERAWREHLAFLTPLPPSVRLIYLPVERRTSANRYTCLTGTFLCQSPQLSARTARPRS